MHEGQTFIKVRKRRSAKEKKMTPTMEEELERETTKAENLLRARFEFLY